MCRINYETIPALLICLLLAGCSQHENGQLIHVAGEGDVQRVEKLLAEGADINAIDKNHRSPLREAARRNKPEMVRFLLDHGAVVKEEGRAFSALRIAVSMGHIEVIKVFLAAGMDPGLKGAYGQTLLHIAAHDEQSEVARLLIMHGATVGVRDENMSTPLYHAAGLGQLGVVKVLLKAGANPNAGENDYNCPLTVALAEKNMDVAQHSRLQEPSHADDSA
ncbi:MAG: ankyrin repeat domain-containing protein [Gammaproteobacteria bacterium]|nr:ankyrin repeat domain-containing protein [Gammaproteobacteria bacterium]